MIDRSDFFKVFDIESVEDFEASAIAIFKYQSIHNPVYKRYCELLGKQNASSINEIPFLPIEFYKNHKVSTQEEHEIVFTSSGTTGNKTSKHYVYDLEVYRKSLWSSFGQTYGSMKDYCILALLPHYLDRQGSSLVYMVDQWLQSCAHPLKGYYLRDLDRLKETLVTLTNSKQKVILIGVTFALLQLSEESPMTLPNVTIIETGGMKGMRKELTRLELHNQLKTAFPQAEIQSEYGMTELLSQAYSLDNLRFTPPSWMKVLARDTNDPLSNIPHGKTGGLNIIDLANFDTCSFIATQDLGKTYSNGNFEVLGRFDYSDIRGCNLMSL